MMPSKVCHAIALHLAIVTQYFALPSKAVFHLTKMQNLSCALGLIRILLPAIIIVYINEWILPCSIFCVQVLFKESLANTCAYIYDMNEPAYYTAIEKLSY